MADMPDAISVRDAVEIVRMPWLSALQPWSRAGDTSCVWRWTLSEWRKAHCLWRMLSGGARQRVHIARALAQQRGVLRLDEPTHHLDIHQQLTKALAIHDPDRALEYDRLVVMSADRAVGEGTPAQVLRFTPLPSRSDASNALNEDPEIWRKN